MQDQAGNLWIGTQADGMCVFDGNEFVAIPFPGKRSADHPNVKAILINIFGGIVRCDRVATGVVEAYKNIGSIDVPIIVRLQGTNAEEGAKIIEESGLKVTSAIVLKDAAAKVKAVLS